MSIRQLFLLILVTVATLRCTPLSSAEEWESYSRHLRDAERYLRGENLPKARAAYEKHINSRLKVKDRPEWENPYFYSLLVGDLYLEEGNQEEALKSYEFALSKGVDKGLVSDRFRLVANKLAEAGDHHGAIQLLNEKRELDSLLYDMMRDRIARKMVEVEEENIQQRK